jgi:hypothetical protein
VRCRGPARPELPTLAGHGRPGLRAKSGSGAGRLAGVAAGSGCIRKPPRLPRSSLRQCPASAGLRLLQELSARVQLRAAVVAAAAASVAAVFRQPFFERTANTPPHTCVFPNAALHCCQPARAD